MNNDTKPNPKRYRELCTPFVSNDAANEALKAFYADVEIAREKHKIPDVVVLCEVSHMIEEDEVRGSSSFQLGDSAKRVPMLAREYGAARQAYEDGLARLMAQARKSR